MYTSKYTNDVIGSSASFVRKYTGIGSRRTPPAIIELMSTFASDAASEGVILRSGAADGADAAFERGCLNSKGQCEIYLPWKKFNGHDSELYDVPKQAYEIASKYHPLWYRLGGAVKSLLARDVQQVLGQNLDDPSSFVVCWTPDGCETMNQYSEKTGGTGMAICVADDYGIPVLNLKHLVNHSLMYELLYEHKTT